MADLVSEIADVQADFQHIADLHDWVCLAMPPWGKVGIPTIGELVMPVAPPPEPPGKILDGSGQPIPPSKASLLEKAEYAKAVRSIRFCDEHGRDRDASIEEYAKAIQRREYLNSHQGMVEVYGPPPWVLPPKDPRRQRITAHADALTCKAEQLLLRVLDGPNQISADIQEHIRERDKECPLWGWVLWLRYSVAISGPTWRIENYPQVAATGLMALGDVVGAKTEAPGPTKGEVASVDSGAASGQPAGDDNPLHSNGRKKKKPGPKKPRYNLTDDAKIFKKWEDGYTDGNFRKYEECDKTHGYDLGTTRAAVARHRGRDRRMK